MPAFIRNLNNNNAIPDQDLDTYVERLLREILQTNPVESELLDANVKQEFTGENFKDIQSVNSTNPLRLLILYRFDESNPLNIIRSRFTTNLVASWYLVYNISFKAKTEFGTNSFDGEKFKKAIRLVEQYCTNNIVKYETNINSFIYETNLNTNRRVDNPNDGNIYTDESETTYLRAQMSILFHFERKINS